MKKIIALIIAAVMLIALATIGVSADEGHYVWTDTGSHVEDPWNHTLRVGHEDPLTASVRFKTDVSFSKIIFAKIWSTAEAPISIELVSGGSTVYSDSFSLLAENGSGDVANVEIDLGKTVPAGEYTLNLSVGAGTYAFFAYGTQPLPDDYIEYERGRVMFGLYTTDSGAGFVSLGIVIAEKTVDVFNGSGDGGAQNLKGGNIAVVITVPDGYKMTEIIGLNSPTWSNPDGGSDAMVEVYAWDGDYDSSIGGTMLASAEVIDHADNANAVFTLDNALSAGQYLAEFSATGDMNIGFWAFGAADGDAYVFVNGTETTAFYPKVAIQLVSDAAPVHEPIIRSFDSTLDKQYFDQVRVNGTEIANGNDALIELKKGVIDGTQGDITTISTYGWYASLQDGITLDQFGYKIDDNDPVFSADFTTDTAQDVLDLGGTRYLVNIDVSALKDGEVHTLTTLCKLSNGDIVIFDRANREAIVRYQAPKTTQPATLPETETEVNTGTGDMTVAMFAVIAVLAMGAAVVFMKKKAF